MLPVALIKKHLHYCLLLSESGSQVQPRKEATYSFRVERSATQKKAAYSFLFPNQKAALRVSKLLALLYKAAFPVTSMVIFSVRIRDMIVYGASLMKAGVNPAHSVKTPSSDKIFMKQSTMDLYLSVPSLPIFWF
jgi:hypothetical protein